MGFLRSSHNCILYVVPSCFVVILLCHKMRWLLMFRMVQQFIYRFSYVSSGEIISTVKLQHWIASYINISLSTIVLNSRDWSEIVWLPKILRFKINLAIGLYSKKTAGIHWLGYNDAVSWLNKAKTRIFQPTVNFEIFEIYLYFVCQPACLPAVRPGCARCRAPEISHDKHNGGRFTKMLFRRRFTHCAMAIPFILLSPSLFFIPLARCESHLRRCR